MPVGTVKWFDPTEKRYGFIRRGNHEPDVFVHDADVELGQLEQGDQVSFELGQDAQGRPKAVHVRVVQKANPRGRPVGWEKGSR